MPPGTRVQTGAKTGKPIDPDNGAEPIYPKRISTTVKAVWTAAAKKGVETRCANIA